MLLRSKYISRLSSQWQLKIHYECIHECAFAQLWNIIKKKSVSGINLSFYIYRMLAHIMYRYYAISITVVFFVATWYRKFFVEIAKCLFSCVVRAIWKIPFVSTRIQILEHGFIFLVAAHRGVRYNTLADIPIHPRSIYDTHISAEFLQYKKNELSLY